jgi:hypothetical protein
MRVLKGCYLSGKSVAPSPQFPKRGGRLSGRGTSDAIIADLCLRSIVTNRPRAACCNDQVKCRCRGFGVIAEFG